MEEIGSSDNNCLMEGGLIVRLEQINYWGFL